MITGAFCIGALLALALYTYIVEFKSGSLYSRILNCIVILLGIYAVVLYFDSVTDLYFLLLGAFAGLLFHLIYKRIFVSSKLYCLLTDTGKNKDIEVTEEEDFMNTRKGKIVTIVVAILVVYAIISTACIIKLNQKINSMVVITDELREEITR